MNAVKRDYAAGGVERVLGQQRPCVVAYWLGPLGLDPAERKVWAIYGPQGLASAGQAFKARDQRERKNPKSRGV